MSRTRPKSVSKAMSKVVRLLVQIMDDDSISVKEKEEFLEYVEATVFEWQLELESDGDIEDDSFDEDDFDDED